MATLAVCARAVRSPLCHQVCRAICDAQTMAVTVLWRQFTNTINELHLSKLILEFTIDMSNGIFCNCLLMIGLFRLKYVIRALVIHISSKF